MQDEDAYRHAAPIRDIANLIEQRCDLTVRRFNSGLANGFVHTRTWG
jgi:hypothetical protein